MNQLNPGPAQAFDDPRMSLPGVPAAPAAPAPQHMLMSPSIDKIASAMAAVQAQLFAPPRNKEVTITPKGKPSFKFRYTTMDVINAMLKGPCAEQHLTVQSVGSFVNGKEVLVVRVVHGPSGQYFQSLFPLRSGQDDEALTGWGGKLTYMRRYGICALFNIAPDDDVDAGMSSGDVVVPGSAEEAERLAGWSVAEQYSRIIAECNGARSAS